MKQPKVMRLRVKKDVVIYHPCVLVAEEGSILRCTHITFGVIGDNSIMNETLNPKEFAEHFELLEDST